MSRRSLQRPAPAGSGAQEVRTVVPSMAEGRESLSPRGLMVLVHGELGSDVVVKEEHAAIGLDHVEAEPVHVPTMRPT